ncbi:MAG TPA: energy transducer TonB [Pyrinomonadaceae bacterium]|nr:energy transducer TonB [Pyrinomonadaceae bacterium]
MNVRHSTANTNEYQPTIIEDGLLLSRLATEFQFVKHELKRAWIEFKTDPRHFAASAIHSAVGQIRTKAHALPATSIALIIVAIAVASVLLIDREKQELTSAIEDEPGPKVVILDLNRQHEPEAESKAESKPDTGIGKDGKGRVGFQNGKGEGSGASPKLARGGGGGGDSEPRPPQVGKLPPPSSILAAIPKTPPINPPSLPAAGIDIDPALWKDLKAPVYGDPRSNSDVPSKGPGQGGGIGTNQGLGIGEGKGPGVGPGVDGNMGSGTKEIGGGGIGGGPDGSDRPFRNREVEQRARLLSKPEPHYTEEARRNQIIGTVMLQVVFSSAGEVVQIRAVRTLPFGLTERAIAAAREIKFVPAVKGGRPVSVYMQLEYNFNLY